MFGFIVFLHVVVCVLLATIILMQSGRGGGLTENFSAAESMFGAKTNVVLVKATTVLASLFIVTCLSLAFLSSKSNKSLINESVMNREHTTAPQAQAVPAKEENSNSSVATKTTGENANQEKTETQPAATPEQPKNPQ